MRVETLRWISSDTCWRDSWLEQICSLNNSVKKTLLRQITLVQFWASALQQYSAGRKNEVVSLLCRHRQETFYLWKHSINSSLLVSHLHLVLWTQQVTVSLSLWLLEVGSTEAAESFCSVPFCERRESPLNPCVSALHSNCLFFYFGWTDMCTHPHSGQRKTTDNSNTTLTCGGVVQKHWGMYKYQWVLYHTSDYDEEPKANRMKPILSSGYDKITFTLSY